MSMQYKCLIWYSNLALPEDGNEFNAKFLGDACKIIQDEINENISNKFQFNIEFCHIEKGEEGLIKLFDRFANLEEGFFTNAHSIQKYNDEILEKIENKKAFLFHTSPDLLTDPSRNIFGISKVDRQAKLDLINDEINKKNNNKVYFIHNEERLFSEVINKHKDNKLFNSLSLKNFEENDEIKKQVTDIFKDITEDDLIVLDLNLKYYREIFNYLEENDKRNRVVNTFGSIQNRFEKISFDLVQTVANLATPSLSVEDLFLKVFKVDLPAEKRTLLMDSIYRLEIPLLAAQALNKCTVDELAQQDQSAIRKSILSFDGKKDVFLGKRLEYGFDSNGRNILKDTYCYTFPNSLQIRDYDVPKILNSTQYKSVEGKEIKLNVVYSYIDILRVTNIDIQSRFWTAEFYLDVVAQSNAPIDDIIFNNLSTLNDKFEYKIIWTRKESGTDYSTKRYYVVANFDFLPLADNYPFDWQNLFISMTLKDNSSHVLQPIPIELIDQEFDINEWTIERSFSGIKYQKNRMFEDTDLKKTVNVLSENRVGWILKRKNTATLLKMGIPMFFLIFLVYYSVFLDYQSASESIGILTTTFLSAIALYFSVEKPEPKKMTIIDLIFVWFYIINGITVVTYGLASFFSEKMFYLTTVSLKSLIPVSLVGMGIYLYRRILKNREDILLDREV